MSYLVNNIVLGGGDSGVNLSFDKLTLEETSPGTQNNESNESDTNYNNDETDTQKENDDMMSDEEYFLKYYSYDLYHGDDEWDSDDGEYQEDDFVISAPKVPEPEEDYDDYRDDDDYDPYDDYDSCSDLDT
jgi:hypothetical protein